VLLLKLKSAVGSGGELEISRHYYVAMMLCCPVCKNFAFLDWVECVNCASELGYRHTTLDYLPVHPDGTAGEARGKTAADAGGDTLRTCSNRPWGCNWLVADSEESGRCFSCRLSRRLPDRADTIAWEKLHETGIAKRRLLVQLMQLDLPITPFYEREGGLGFDLLSSMSGTKVMIGHANGIITIDLTETLDAYRETLRVKLGEAYRTILGHFRHEIGHYYQGVLITTDEQWDACRTLFGDERASYQDAITRHYNSGAPEDWGDSYISEYATMHPWEDFAETFAHYLHITGTLDTAASAGVVLSADRVPGIVDHDIVPQRDYRELGLDRMLEDWRWLSLMFNRVNRAMGQRDLYPFSLTKPVIAKLRFVHELVVAGAKTLAGGGGS
jgi:hypothetical protein